MALRVLNTRKPSQRLLPVQISPRLGRSGTAWPNYTPLPVVSGETKTMVYQELASSRTPTALDLNRRMVAKHGTRYIGRLRTT